MNTRRTKRDVPVPAKDKCPKCSLAQNGGMVQCDKCDQWFHMRCVEVDENVKDVPWSCSTCQPVATVNDGDGARKPPSAISKPKSRHTISDAQSVAALELKKLDDEFNLKMQQLENERKLLQAEREIREEHIKKKYELEKRLTLTDDDDDDTGSDGFYDVVNWLEECEIEKVQPKPFQENKIFPIETSKISQRPVQETNAAMISNQSRPVMHEGLDKVKGITQQDTFQKVNNYMRDNSLPTAGNHVMNYTEPNLDFYRGHPPQNWDACAPSSQQVAARKSMNTELPIFSGRP